MRVLKSKEGEVVVLGEVGPSGYYEPKDIRVPVEAWQIFRGCPIVEGGTTIQVPMECEITIRYPFLPAKPRTKKERT